MLRVDQCYSKANHSNLITESSPERLTGKLQSNPFPQSKLPSYPNLHSPLLSRAMEERGRGGVTNPASHPRASVGSLMPWRLTTQRGPPTIRESIPPSGDPKNWFPSASVPMGSLREPAPPRFSNQGKLQWPLWRWAANGGDGRRGLPFALKNDQRLERATIGCEWARCREDWF